MFLRSKSILPFISTVFTMVLLVIGVSDVTLAQEPNVTLLATGLLPAEGLQAEVTSEGFIFHVYDITMEPDEPAVGPRRIFGSMFYALESPFNVAAGGNSLTLAPGEAVWVNFLEAHTLAPDETQAAHFIQFVITSPEERGALQNVPGFQNGRVVFESQELTFVSPGEQETILEQFDFQAGSGETQDLVGPTVFRALSGSFHITLEDASLTMQAGDYLALPAGATLAIAADWSTEGQLLKFSIVPTE